LNPGALLELPAGAARHVQVLRLQPGTNITLFNGELDQQGLCGEFGATITRMGRSDVQVQVDSYQTTNREASRCVHLALGMPANERMDWLVEKATELGVASIQPLMTDRSVLRLSGERADKKLAHWHSVAVAACEQCGGNRVPKIHAVLSLATWLQQASSPDIIGQPLLLSLRPQAVALRHMLATADAAPASFTFLSGPEGGLSPGEEQAALDAGFAPVSLGNRVLRAETAALAALAALLL
jgi:16S rRNA (uracil1498-N3)-methyltransferase